MCFADNAQRLLLVANVDDAWHFWSGLTLVHAVSLHVVSSMPRVHGICMRKSVCSSWSMLCSALRACSCIGFFVTRFPKHLFYQWPSRGFNVAQVTLRWRLFSRYSRRFIISMAGTAPVVDSRHHHVRSLVAHVSRRRRRRCCGCLLHIAWSDGALGTAAGSGEVCRAPGPFLKWAGC